ncbi:MAG TPA: hypothetical protein VHM30_16280 [Gemmatimonadaceae bacterium]|nr:hypothetical protein [Gemmatimonadaceae bacterium]
MPSSLRRAPRGLAPFAAAAVAFVALAATCGPRNDATLTGLCEGRNAEQRVDATVDTVLPYGGPALAAVKGRHFALHIAFSPPPLTGPAAGTAECQGAMGEAHFSGDIPLPLRGGAAQDNTAGWRIEGDTILVDLNPKARDSNLVMSLPLRGGRGHWALSTFAGETVRGAATTGR